MKPASTSEFLLALRNPDAGWLGVLACVIDEANRDPQFDERQRQLALQLLHSGALPASVARAAQERAACFEAELDNAGATPVEPAVVERPKLTLVAS